MSNINQSPTKESIYVPCNFKDQGNKEFRLKNYEKAIVYFSQAISSARESATVFQ